MTLCKPKWHDQLALEVRPRSQAVGRLDISGCSQRSDGTITCTPAAMRVTVEAMLRSAGLLGTSGVSSLGQDVYSLARCIASEGGSGEVEEKVALGEAVYNYARKRGRNLTALLTTSSGWYGSQAAVGYASTARAPTWEDIVVARMAIDEVTGGFVQGATNFFGPDAFGSENRLQEVFHNWTDKGARWIGRLPGVSSRRQMFFVYGPKDSEWAGARQAALAELAAPTYVSVQGLPLCQGLIVSKQTKGLMMAAAVGVVAIGGIAILRR